MNSTDSLKVEEQNQQNIPITSRD